MSGQGEGGSSPNLDSLLADAVSQRWLVDDEVGRQKRQRILVQLNHVVMKWIQEMHKDEKKFPNFPKVLKAGPDGLAGRAGGILVFGSFSLFKGYPMPHSDLDCLCLAPNSVSRDDFFKKLSLRLKKKLHLPNVTLIERAHVPIMKFTLEDVDFDLLFAALPLEVLEGPREAILSDTVLLGLDAVTARSLNGPRTANALLKMVPNQDVFGQVLRFVKAWARHRGVYSNVLGFLGGVAWSILCAYVCREFGKKGETAAVLIRKFFETFADWKWGIGHPVRLGTQGEEQKAGRGGGGASELQPWSTKREQDRKHLIAILTPAWPSTNSAYNVSPSTLRVLKEEFLRGKIILEEDSPAFSSGRNPFLTVLQSLRFFTHCPRFAAEVEAGEEEEDFEEEMRPDRRIVEVKILGAAVKPGEERDPYQWKGFVESRLRHLYSVIDSAVEGINIRPYPEAYRIKDTTNQHPNSWAVHAALIPDEEVIQQRKREEALRMIAEWKEQGMKGPFPIKAGDSIPVLNMNLEKICKEFTTSLFVQWLQQGHKFKEILEQPNEPPAVFVRFRTMLPHHVPKSYCNVAPYLPPHEEKDKDSGNEEEEKSSSSVPSSRTYYSRNSRDHSDNDISYRSSADSRSSGSRAGRGEENGKERAGRGTGKRQRKGGSRKWQQPSSQARRLRLVRASSSAGGEGARGETGDAGEGGEEGVGRPLRLSDGMESDTSSEFLRARDLGEREMGAEYESSELWEEERGREGDFSDSLSRGSRSFSEREEEGGGGNRRSETEKEGERGGSASMLAALKAKLREKSLMKPGGQQKDQHQTPSAGGSPSSQADRQMGEGESPPGKQTGEAASASPPSAVGGRITLTRAAPPPPSSDEPSPAGGEGNEGSGKGTGSPSQGSPTEQEKGEVQVERRAEGLERRTSIRLIPAQKASSPSPQDPQ
uniref:polynucleotide adenylyltransferase n=1 Tax=Chromera velia CCMP2878 TaxID=1169474 RepID=A0A0K6S9T4_9ALVE|eukprot:Cvel_8418.t3-p1 / transcript=Cvel_8418.t3 / gene=Cvel_8418 / organism=Chromera_velia_CCMP2878 / gene_product=hypothetical protein / transcript_product=hypothetical protein / location=Cvel_scaffold465:5167-11363(+) / protein_length=932 / sequence_SO=supercontig / SO=protein_coding / is_pseudo=false